MRATGGVSEVAGSPPARELGFGMGTRGTRMNQVETAVLGTVSSREEAHVAMPVSRFDREICTECFDSVIQEIGIEVTVDGRAAFAATCSPWDIEELVVGRLFFEGAIADASSLDSVKIDYERGRVDVRLRRHERLAVNACSIIPFDGLPRSSSQAGRARAHGSRVSVSARTLSAAIAMLEDKSLLFRKTGGVHSAVLADSRGTVRAWCEDIGRHSAVDKLAGLCVLDGIDASKHILLFSGRVPQEIIAKVDALGCPIVASPGAPTNLSIEIAERQGITLVGFAKGDRFNVYAHPERITGWQTEGRNPLRNAAAPLAFKS